MIWVILAIVSAIIGFFPLGCLVADIIRTIIDNIKYGPSVSGSDSDIDNFEYYGPDPTDDFDD